LYSGSVFFVGAGPGDPELLTLKAQRLIAQADVILYAGSLVNPAVLAYARAGVVVYNSAGMKLADQITLMCAAAAKGQTVVRLHTGDPSVYGAIFEQMQELAAAGVGYSIVPGVSSAFAAAASLGIEYTLPGETQTVIFTRLSGQTSVPDGESLQELAAHRSSLVVFLSAGMIDRVVENLRQAGYDGSTPAAVVFRASWPDESILRGRLDTIVAQVQSAEITHQALIVISPALAAGKEKPTRVSHLYGTALNTPKRCETTAIVTLTRSGTETGRRLHALLPQSVLYAPARFLDVGVAAASDVRPYADSIRQVLQSAFREHTGLVCILATGIVVRELASLLQGKHMDPAVVVLDEDGRFAISLLGGHLGGANQLARRLSELLGCTPVLTTASDVRGLPAMDLLGAEEGWVLRQEEHLTALSAALVNGDHVGVFQGYGQQKLVAVFPTPQLDPLSFTESPGSC